LGADLSVGYINAGWDGHGGKRRFDGCADTCISIYRSSRKTMNCEQ
jgi:hypothetical protein